MAIVTGGVVKRGASVTAMSREPKLIGNTSVFRSKVLNGMPGAICNSPSLPAKPICATVPGIGSA